MSTSADKQVKCLPLPSSGMDASGGPGACQQCVAGGSECIYPPTRDRAAYSRQYVQNLEARVQALEGVWGRMVPVLEAFEGGSSLMGNGSTLPPIPPFPAPMQEEDGEDDAGSDRHSLEDGQITQDERGNYRWIGSSNTLSLLDSFSNQPLQTPLSSTPHTHTPDRNPYFGPVAGSGVVKALPGVDEVSYPTHRAAREMVDAFFSDVHPTLPVVLEYEFRQEFDALMDRRSRGEVETSSQTVSATVIRCAPADDSSFQSYSQCLLWERGWWSPTELGREQERPVQAMYSQEKQKQE